MAMRTATLCCLIVFSVSELTDQTSHGSSQSCKLAIVGAGPGGIYTAWRLVIDSKTFAPTDVCVFERSQRVGGRTLSVRGQGSRGDLVVDMGAYRFCGNLAADNCPGCEMCMPLMANLIQKALGLATESYEPGGHDKEAKFVKIVDADGANAGLHTYVEVMYNASRTAGVRFFFGHEAISLQMPPPGLLQSTNPSLKVSLQCAGSTAGASCAATASAEQIFLNVPLMPAMKLLRASPSLKPYFKDGAFPSFLRIPYPIRHVKYYVHYDWAWWRTLGKTFGNFQLDGGCSGTRVLEPCSAETSSLPLDGRYHDGPFRCDDGNSTGRACRGFIEATYTSDGVTPYRVNWFKNFQTHTDPPYVVVDRNTSADGEELLRQTHERLLALHKGELESAGIYSEVAALLPTMALLSLWDQSSVGLGSGTHVMGQGSTPGGAYAPGAAAGTVPAKTIKPFKDLNFFIANEAYHASDFAEGSLEMAENIVHKHMGAPAPTWMAPATYAQIMFGPPEDSSVDKPPAAAQPGGKGGMGDLTTWSAQNCSGPFGEHMPPILRHRPSGTPVPEFLVMAAPFTPFFSNGDLNTGAILPLAALFKEKLGVNAVWVMGMRGQYDTLSTDERKAVAAAWVEAGRTHGLFTIIQVGDSCQRRAAEMASHAEQIGADAIGALGPYEELCSDTKCVVDFLAPVAAAAPKTPFFYYHTPGWNGKGLNGVKMYDWFQLAATAIPTAVGVKFESYDDGEFAQTCKQYGSTKLMLYAPCDSLGHWEQKTPGRGAFIQAFLAPMCHRIRAAFERGDAAAMKAELSFRDGCQNAGGNFIERYFYEGFGMGIEMGHPRPPQPRATPSQLAEMNRTLHSCGFYNQSWPSARTSRDVYIV